MTAKSLWWVRAVDEFLCALNSSSLIRREKIQNTTVDSPLKSSIDQAPYVNIREDGLVTAFNNEPSGEVGNEQHEQLAENVKAGDSIRGDNSTVQQERNATTQFDSVPGPTIDAMISPVKNCLNQLTRRSKISMWILACVAIATTWPILGSALPMFFKKKLCNIFSSSSLKR
ncbi:hypothetical protein K7X08_009143 [Anisodus acutangulus]|uniref:Uncharacterized protein n=1 Tax=Anisodus acutangulus TaxID=402998 RepID=A0A9Q1RTB8_9SOLA|nr:hypothetical protein K7X08_009143 [Anisodus acutangulus]